MVQSCGNAATELRAEQPADLDVVIRLKAARALGFKTGYSILVRLTKVIDVWSRERLPTVEAQSGVGSDELSGGAFTKLSRRLSVCGMTLIAPQTQEQAMNKPYQRDEVEKRQDFEGAKRDLKQSEQDTHKGPAAHMPKESESGEEAK